MSIDETRRTMDRYFAAMGRDDDFSSFYTADVSWAMVESGDVIHGPSDVRDYIISLHRKMFGGEQRDLVSADGHAFLEGYCAAAPDRSEPRYDYCLVYDLENRQIQAMRCYGSIARILVDT